MSATKGQLDPANAPVSDLRDLVLAVYVQILTLEFSDESSTSMMTPYWANQSCDPFTDRKLPCILGTYTQYAVNVSSIDEIKETIAYAKKKNIRLVIRNTGHEYVKTPARTFLCKALTFS